jgi:hypothetical protein
MSADGNRSTSVPLSISSFWRSWSDHHWRCFQMQCPVNLGGDARAVGARPQGVQVSAASVALDPHRLPLRHRESVSTTQLTEVDLAQRLRAHAGVGDRGPQQRPVTRALTDLDRSGQFRRGGQPLLHARRKQATRRSRPRHGVRGQHDRGRDPMDAAGTDRLRRDRAPSGVQLE